MLPLQDIRVLDCSTLLPGPLASLILAEAGAEVIMLDNMALGEIREAVALIAGRALVEISGGVGAHNLEPLLAAGADLISVGALTHSARSVDISMRIVNA